MTCASLSSSPYNSREQSSTAAVSHGTCRFDSDRAWNCLVTNFFVYSLRHYRDNAPEEQLVRIIRDSRDAGLRASKNLIATISNEEFSCLDGYVTRSGFDSVEAWLEEANRLSGPAEKWQLFCVDLDEPSRKRAREQVPVEVL